MRKLLIILFTFVYSATNAQIKYVSSFEAALDLAKKENKFVFVKYYGESCSHCQDLQKILEIDSIEQKFNNTFISFKINSENLSPKDEAFIDKYKFNIDQIPFLFFFDADGNFIHFSIPKTEASFVNRIPQMVINPKERTSYLATKYQMGMRDENTLKMYCKLARLQSNDSLEKQLGNDIYINYPDAQILSKSGIVTLAKYIKHIDNGMYRVWMENYSKLDSLVPEFKYAEKKKVFVDIMMEDINKNKSKWASKDFDLAVKYLKIIEPDKNHYIYFWQEMSEKLLQEGKEIEALKIGESILDASSFGMNKYVIDTYLQKHSKIQNIDPVKSWIEKQLETCKEPEFIAQFMVQMISYYNIKKDVEKVKSLTKETEKYIQEHKLSKDLMKEVVKI
ncbi:MAG: thioredoxin family protein [Flavobacteriia bacterium]|jgi:thiol-disulfide isomerase/thioredoxin